MEFFTRSTFCMVTGASRGLGREIAIQFSHEWSKAGVQSDVVLLSRSMEGLQETKARIAAVAPGIGVHMVQANLEDLDSLQKVFSDAANFGDEEKHQQFVLVHNAGTPGDLSKPMIQQTDPKMVQSCFATNYTSMFVLTSHFLSRFTSGHRTIINITSLLAKVYLPSFALYSTTRAARNALMGVLAVENPDVRILSYSPGPCDTDMLRSIPLQTFSSSVAEQFTSQIETQTVLTCQQSISKLVGILQEDKFENAAVVDYYD